MHRRAVLEMLERYREKFPIEALRVDRFSAFVAEHSDCFERSCRVGHVTASAWIVSHDRLEFLLTHHRKLGRWLQLGGHADGDSDVRGVALREAREESGMEGFHVLSDPAGFELLDVDIHGIPARPSEPAHDHFDLRFLLAAEPDQPLRMSGESMDLRWYGREQLGEFAEQESLSRLGRKACERLDGT